MSHTTTLCGVGERREGEDVEAERRGGREEEGSKGEGGGEGFG
jgi:hypothetical protein